MIKDGKYNRKNTNGNFNSDLVVEGIVFRVLSRRYHMGGNVPPPIGGDRMGGGIYPDGGGIARMRFATYFEMVN